MASSEGTHQAALEGSLALRRGLLLAGSTAASPSEFNNGACFEADYGSPGRVLGTGIGGAVCEACCQRSGRIDAVKTFRKSSMTEVDLMSMRSGISVHAGLSHPCIVSVRGVYEDDEKVQLVMEKLGGGELFDRVMEHGRLSLDEAASAIVQLLRAVAYLHRRQLCHRDIKLENIVCEEVEGSTLKLIDFGSAVRLGDSKALAGRCGTPGYLAPEVLRGRPYTPAADMWSVGICAYALLTGQPAITGRSRKAMNNKTARGAVNYDATFKSLPQDAQQFVHQLLSFDPSRRLSAHEALAHHWLANIVPEQVASAKQEAATQGANLSSRSPGVMNAASLGGSSVSDAPGATVGCIQEVTCLAAVQYTATFWRHVLHRWSGYFKVMP